MQLLVVVIVFTYAVISPIILLFGLLYLWAHWPSTRNRFYMTTVHSMKVVAPCSQLTSNNLSLVFWGYLVTRGCYYQPVFFPCPC